MSMQAVGTYLRTLREAKNLSRGDLAKQVDSNEMQILRIEKGEGDTRGSMLMKLVRLVGGNAEHIADLWSSNSATSDDGKQLAQEHLRMNKNQGKSSESEYVPTTAIGAFMRGMREISRREVHHYEEVHDFTADYISKVERGEISLAEVAIKLMEGNVDKEEISFLVGHPDLPPSVGDRLALTYLDIGDAGEIMKSALATSSSNAG
jgi:transcriptional regulator with XRE-family HTH domain